MLAEYSPYGKFSFIIHLAKAVTHRYTIEEYSKNIHRISMKTSRSPFFFLFRTFEIQAHSVLCDQTLYVKANNVLIY